MTEMIKRVVPVTVRVNRLQTGRILFLALAALAILGLFIYFRGSRMLAFYYFKKKNLQQLILTGETLRIQMLIEQLGSQDVQKQCTANVVQFLIDHGHSEILNTLIQRGVNLSGEQLCQIIARDWKSCVHSFIQHADKNASSAQLLKYLGWDVLRLVWLKSDWRQDVLSTLIASSFYPEHLAIRHAVEENWDEMVRFVVQHSLKEKHLILQNMLDSGSEDAVIHLLFSTPNAIIQPEDLGNKPPNLLAIAFQKQWKRLALKLAEHPPITPFTQDEVIRYHLFSHDPAQCALYKRESWGEVLRKLT